MKFKISILLVLLISSMSQAQITKTNADTLIKTGILVEETKTAEEIKIAQEKALKEKEIYFEESKHICKTRINMSYQQAAEAYEKSDSL